MKEKQTYQFKTEIEQLLDLLKQMHFIPIKKFF